MYFTTMRATLTELRRETGRIIRAAEKGADIILTEHGKPRLKLSPVKVTDRKAAAAALKAIGPVDFPPRR